MRPKLWRRLFADRDCGLLSMMGALTRGIAAWFSRRRRAKGEDRGLELRPARIKYLRLKDSDVYSVADDEVDALYHAGEASMDDYGHTNFPQVKHDQICSEVFRLLDNDDIKMVALCGVRGVGKSTALRRLEIEALSSQKFSIVVHVVSPVSGNIEEKIMNAFWRLQVPTLDSHIEYNRILGQSLQYKPVLLLLDDVVKPIQFNCMRFPFDTSGKIVFTTRERSVPHDMGSPLLQVEPLDDEEAWDLFRTELGEDVAMVSDPIVMKLAKVMVEECHGLPLALKVLAGVMKGRRSLEDLTTNVAELNNPIKLFRFILDSLPSDVVKECFLYTALFPKNYWICEQQLMEYWIGEGFLSNGCNNMTTAIKQGQDVIGKLKAANLLEERTPSRGNMGKAVKVLDSLRQEALCDNHGLLVESGVNLKKEPAAKRWKMAKRVSLMSNDIEKLEATPRCYWLETLFINDNYHLHSIPKGFFQFMPLVKVLDLSGTYFTELPKSIGKMVALQYLNLSFTPIESLPEELGNLKKLKCLRLQRTRRVQSIPRGLLSNFVELQLFNMTDSGFKLTEDNDNIIWELEHLKDLRIVGICIRDIRSLYKMSKSMEMGQNLMYVQISECHDVEFIDLISYFGFMKSLKELSVGNFPYLEEITVDGANGYSDGNQMLTSLESLIIHGQHKLRSFDARRLSCFQNLQTLKIVACSLLRNICWVQHLPNLIDLVLVGNSRMDNIFSEKVKGFEGCFPKLRFMTLSTLSGLQDIGGDSVVFPSLETLIIFDCPKLRKLPKGLLCGNLKEIRCNWEWWRTLCKQMETTRFSIYPYFIGRVSFRDQ